MAFYKLKKIESMTAIPPDPPTFKGYIELQSSDAMASLMFYDDAGDDAGTHWDFSIEIFGPDAPIETPVTAQLCPPSGTGSCVSTNAPLPSGRIPVSLTVHGDGKISATVGDITLDTTYSGTPQGDWYLAINTRNGGATFSDLELVTNECRGGREVWLIREHMEDWHDKVWGPGSTTHSLPPNDLHITLYPEDNGEGWWYYTGAYPAYTDSDEVEIECKIDLPDEVGGEVSFHLYYPDPVGDYDSGPWTNVLLYFSCYWYVGGEEYGFVQVGDAVVDYGSDPSYDHGEILQDINNVVKIVYTASTQRWRVWVNDHLLFDGDGPALDLDDLRIAFIWADHPQRTMRAKLYDLVWRVQPAGTSEDGGGPGELEVFSLFAASEPGLLNASTMSLSSPCAVTGSCGNWPSADAINARIARSEANNGRSSPLHGMGQEFLRLGAKYGVNPGVVTAILQRESQLAADGSFLPTNANNFGGLTGSGPCGSIFYIDRNWAVFCDPAQGLEGVFARLKEPQYTSTDGTLAAVMEVYSPSFENDVNAMWQIFRAVAAELGITLEPSTPVYSSRPECTTGPGGIPIPAPPSGGAGYGGYTTMFEYALHAVGARVTQGPWGAWSHSRCDCYDFGCPIGTPIYPVLPGTVIVSTATSDVYAPNVVVVQTAYGNIRYAHLSSRAVSVGQQVGLETLLGCSGAAGTGPHLHLGLDGGTGPYTLDQILYAAGVAIGAFPWA